MQYFEVEADYEHFSDRWFLDDPVNEQGDLIDPREFRYGHRYNGSKPVHLPVDRPGWEVAFNLGPFNMPVITKEVGEILGRLAKNEIERFPVSVGPQRGNGWEIMNAISTVPCVDERKSHFTRFGNDAPQKRLIGKYQMFLKLRIDPAKAAGHHIFRIKDWVVALIVSDEIRRALIPVKNLGIVFLPVTDI